MKYDQMLKNMNESQLEVVHKIDGAALVNAPAGSGKTATVSVRVGYMLSSPDHQIDPSNILILTFTESGASELRKRLVDYIGIDAYKIVISTFHAFANQVVNDNLDYFGIDGFEAASDLENIAIVEEIIDSLSWDHPLKRITGNQYFDVPRLLKLFNMMKQEFWDFNTIKNAANEYLDSLPFDEDFIYKRGNSKTGVKKGDVNQGKIDSVKEKLDKLIAAAGLINVYNDKLRAKKLFTFSDMLNFVVDLFQNKPNVLLEYQERFQYVIVDESQDNSGTQAMTINLLMDYWENPNLMYVGDTQQVIYEFAGARIQNVFEFKQRYSPSIFNLDKNYRSTQEIVDYARNVISNAKDGSYNDIDVTGMNPNEGSVSCEKYSNVSQEYVGIAKKIKMLIDSGETPSNIGVLYRKNAHGEPLMKYIRDMGIPVTTKRKINVLKEPIIRQLLLILQYLISPEKGEKSDLFFQILHFNFLGVHRRQIERLLVLLRDGGKISDLDARSFKTVNAVIKLLDDALYIMHNESLLTLLHELYYNTGIKTILTENRDKRAISSLKTFFNFVQEQSEKQFDISVEDLLNQVRRMESQNIFLPIEDTIGGTNGVVFSTVHNSKGLEWKHVFMIRSNRQEWEKSRSVSNNFALPPNLTHSVSDDKEESSRKLFYVGMTRAKQFLNISFADADDKGKGLDPSQFILESQIAIDKLEPIDTSDFILESMNPDAEKFEPEVEKEKIDAIVDNFRMSPSSLNLYMDCPLSFYYEKILRVPYIQSYPAVYGSACHHAISQVYIKKQYDADFFIQSAIEYVDKYGVHLSNKERGRMVKAIKKILPDFFDKYLRPGKVVLSEFKARDIIINGVPCYGEIDEIEFDGLDADVSDFKTGNPDNIKKKMLPPNDDEGGKYWRQLVFYKLLIDSDHRKNWRTRVLRVVPINDDPKPIALAYEAHHDKIVKDQIKQAYMGIKSHDFHGCGKEDCKWCSIVK